MSNLTELSMTAFLDRVTGALAANDATQLEQLLSMSQHVPLPERRENQFAAMSRLHLLAAMLGETARNIRLLRRARRFGQFNQPISYGRSEL